MTQEVSASDGFRCEIVKIDNRLTLCVEVRGAGEAVAATPVMSYSDDTIGSGEASRMQCLLTAVCRYLNAGGSLLELLEMTENMLRDLPTCVIEFPQGWYVMACIQSIPEPTIVLVNEDEGLVQVIVEDTYVEQMNIEDFKVRFY